MPSLSFEWMFRRTLITSWHGLSETIQREPMADGHEMGDPWGPATPPPLTFRQRLEK